jgi:hypothetical protein
MPSDQGFDDPSISGKCPQSPENAPSAAVPGGPIEENGSYPQLGAGRQGAGKSHEINRLSAGAELSRLTQFLGG